MFYISSGLGNGMYTLREYHVFPTNFGFSESDRYVKNLSRDFDKAIVKAKEFVGDKDKLEIGKEFDLNAWGDADRDYYVVPELSPEEIAKREAEALKQQEEKDKDEAEYQAVLLERQKIYDMAEPVPTLDERIEFSGVIEKTYIKESQWGSQRRCFFIDDRGFKLNGTCPKIVVQREDEDGFYDVNEYPQEGERVTFIARVSVSDEDPKFGFFKRAKLIRSKQS